MEVNGVAALSQAQRGIYGQEIDLLRAVFIVPVDKYGTAIDGLAPVWTLITERDRAVYRYLLRRDYRGECIPSIRRIALDLDMSESTAIRTLRRLRHFGLISWIQRRADEGDYTSNLYTMHDPGKPSGPLAVLRAGKVMRLHPNHPIPDFSPRASIRSVAKPAEPPKAPAAPLVVPPAWARQIAESEGVAHDLHLVSEAWQRLLARCKVKGKPVKSVGALFRHLLRILPAELQLTVKRVETQGRNPAQVEQNRRKAWLWVETQRLLSTGEKPDSVPIHLMRHPAVASFAIWSEFTEIEIRTEFRLAAEHWQKQHAEASAMPSDMQTEIARRLRPYLDQGYTSERAAMAVFPTTSGIRYDQILLLAHSLSTARPA